MTKQDCTKVEHIKAWFFGSSFAKSPDSFFPVSSGFCGYFWPSLTSLYRKIFGQYFDPGRIWPKKTMSIFQIRTHVLYLLYHCVLTALLNYNAWEHAFSFLPQIFELFSGSIATTIMLSVFNQLDACTSNKTGSPSRHSPWDPKYVKGYHKNFFSVHFTMKSHWYRCKVDCVQKFIVYGVETLWTETKRFYGHSV